MKFALPVGAVVGGGGKLRRGLGLRRWRRGSTGHRSLGPYLIAGAGRLTRRIPIALAVPTSSSRWFNSLKLGAPAQMCGVRAKNDLVFLVARWLVWREQVFQDGDLRQPRDTAQGPWCPGSRRCRPTG